MLSFLIGVATGVAGGIALKDKLMPSEKENRLTSMVNNLTEQNNTLKSKCRDLELRIAVSKNEIDSLKAKIVKYEDKSDDSDDAIFDLQKANKKLIAEKESLVAELEEAKSLLTVKSQEIEELKDKLSDLSNK